MKKKRMTAAEEAQVASIVCFKLLRLESRCDALEAVLTTTAEKAGLPRDKTERGINELTKAFLQKKLERIENENPALAADMTRWQQADDLPDEFF